MNPAVTSGTGAMVPAAYDYVGHLMDHVGDTRRIFSGVPVWPRQILFYLPGNHRQACNFRCRYCAGRLSKPQLRNWEDEGLRLIELLGDRIPYHQYGGYCTEPTLNPMLLRFIQSTKRNHCCYGLRTNGSLLTKLESEIDFITEVIGISDSPEDFISVSLDAGVAASHARTKGVPEYMFGTVCGAVRELVRIRGSSRSPAIRLTYVLSQGNDSPEEIDAAILFAAEAGVDSLRFSQAHPAYGSENPRRQWEEMDEKEVKYSALFSEILPGRTTKPAVFFAETARPGRIDCCAYGYYQITISHDGCVYRCGTVVDSRYSRFRLGPLTSDLETFEHYIYMNQDPNFDPGECFRLGAYCCRAACAINESFSNHENTLHN